MTVEADLKTALAGACTRVFPDFAPVKTTLPYVTYQQIGGKVINPLDNSMPGKANAEFQINIWANNRSSAAATMLAVELALRSCTSFIAQPIAASVADFDADVPVFGARQDWSIWSDR